MGSVFLLLALSSPSHCKSDDMAFVRGYLMEVSCATLQYSGSSVHIRHARDCLKSTSKELANFAVLEPLDKYKLWHIDASANAELVRHFNLLKDPNDVAISVWGSVRNDPAKGDTVTPCAISFVGAASK
jgi:hypothetical protein